MLALAWRRAWYARKLTPGPLRTYLSTPLIAGSASWLQTDWLAIDLETTSLDPASGEIVSIGWVAMRGGKIQLASARHRTVSIRREVGQSAVFHQLSDAQLAAGAPVSLVLDELLQAASGKVLIFHNARMDMAFLNRICRRLYGAPMLSQVVDTLMWEQRKIASLYQHIPSGTLRLHACRRRYHLPDYPAHDALTDALAALELLQAQILHHDPASRVRQVLAQAGAF